MSRTGKEPLRPVGSLIVRPRVPMYNVTFDKLRDVAASFHRETGREVTPVQAAAAVLEWALSQPGVMQKAAVELLRHGVIQ